jgi:hypothetical protein
VALQVDVSPETAVTDVAVGMVFWLWFFCFLQWSGISDRLARLGLRAKSNSVMLTFGSTGMGKLI